ncbi:DUF397 domain-containing protein [Kitasatospora aureofaciens]|uniref:DUF397 domain-containing protein n=1 Tax=Kitasatospora aureofaciens TaxID=1894 RepID=UPI0033E0CC9A
MSNENGYNVPHVDPDSLEWFISEDSGDQGACVEVAHLPSAVGGVFLRHSKERSGFYYFDDREWAAFLSGAKKGQFDPPASNA